MISYDRLLAEMDRQLTTARHTSDERAMREALSAVRALCDVALNQTPTSATPEKIIPKMLNTPEVQSLSSFEGKPFEGKPLEESDANGGSLFDF